MFDFVGDDFDQFWKRHRTRDRRSEGGGVGPVNLAQVLVVDFASQGRIARKNEKFKKVEMVEQWNNLKG